MPEIEEPVPDPRIVVGVDGSDGSAEGARLGHCRGDSRSPASLELATAWMFPMALGYVFAKTPDEVRQQVQRIADLSVSHVADSRP